MFTVINVQCVDQQLSAVSTPAIASGGVNETIVKFSFCPLWDGFAKTAVFWMDETTPYRVLIDINGECVVPPEVTAKDGRMFFGVFGVNGETTRTSTVLGYTVKKGVATEGVEPDPTPTIYEQILSEHAKTQQFYIDVVGVVEAAKDAAESAADSAKSSANIASAVGDMADDALRIANEAIPKAEAGKPNGVATLDEDGKIPDSMIGDKIFVVHFDDVPDKTFFDIMDAYNEGKFCLLWDKNEKVTACISKADGDLIVFKEMSNSFSAKVYYFGQTNQGKTYVSFGVAKNHPVYKTTLSYDGKNYTASNTASDIHSEFTNGKHCVLVYGSGDVYNLTASTEQTCMFERTRYVSAVNGADVNAIIEQVLVGGITSDGSAAIAVKQSYKFNATATVVGNLSYM